jgi:hypothetical protein
MSALEILLSNKISLLFVRVNFLIIFYYIYTKNYSSIVNMLFNVAFFFVGKYVQKKELRQDADRILDRHKEFGFARHHFSCLEDFRNIYLVSEKQSNQYIDEFYKKSKEMLDNNGNNQNRMYH